MRTKNIYPTQLVIKRKEVKQPQGGDRLTLQYVEDMAKAMKTEIRLYDEQNNRAGIAYIFFKGFCDYYYSDGTRGGSGAMYRMGISLYEYETIGQILHTSDSIKTLYGQPRGNVVKGERNVVNSLGSNPEIHDTGTGVVVNRYVVTADKKEVSYNRSGISFAPASYHRAIELLDTGCNASAGFVELRMPEGKKKQYRVLKISVSVNFAMLS